MYQGSPSFPRFHCRAASTVIPLLPNATKAKYNNNKQNVVIFYNKWKKYNEIQLTKNKMDLNIRKMTNHPPSPEPANHK